jgi:hypothetical protein
VSLGALDWSGKVLNRVVKVFTMPLPCTDTVTSDTRPTEKLGNFRPEAAPVRKDWGLIL